MEMKNEQEEENLQENLVRVFHGYEFTETNTDLLRFNY